MSDERIKAGAAVLQELIASRRLVGGSLKVDEIARLVLEAADAAGERDGGTECLT